MSIDALDQLEQLAPAALITLAAKHGITLPSPADLAQLAQAEALCRPVPISNSPLVRQAIALYQAVAAM